MCNLLDIYNELDLIAPFRLSKELIKQGDYDNSGILIKTHEQVGKVLFSLDLSKEAVRVAKKNKCDTIITHHPAIYHPIKNVSVDHLTTSPVAYAVKENMNVICAHLNLDVATNGIDYYLAKGLNGKDETIVSVLEDDKGYGREFMVEPIRFGEFIKNTQKTFETNKVIAYGNKKEEVRSVASFCGGGSGYAEQFISEKLVTADVIVTADMPHHIIKELVEDGKKILLLTHYSTECYGFKKVYEKINAKLQGKVQTLFFCDKRFM